MRRMLMVMMAVVLTGARFGIGAEGDADAEVGAPAAAAPPRRPIGHDQPLFLFPEYGFRRAGGLVEDLKIINDSFPPEVRERMALFLSFGAMNQKDVYQVAKAGERLLSNTSMGAQSIETNPCVIGFWAYETGFNFGKAETDRKHNGNAWEWLERLKGCGGMVGWNSLWNLKPSFSNPDLYARIRANQDRLFILCKGNGGRGNGWERFGEYIHDHEVMTGMWLTGAVSCWGFHPEEWLWHESNYRRAFEFSLAEHRRWRDQRRQTISYMTTELYPGCLIGEALLNAAVNGCAVLSTESGWNAGGKLGEKHVHVHLPIMRELVARKMIPSREEVRERARAASGGTHRKLYATTATYIQNDGRYGLIPWIPPLAPAEDRKGFEYFPDDYHYSRLPFLNALYPREATGRCYIRRQGKIWVAFNPFETVNKEADFALPLRVNTCSKLSGRFPPYALAIVEEYPDRLEILLTNFWEDRSSMFWDAWYADGGPDLSDKIKGAAERSKRWQAALRPNPRSSFLSLEGHKGPDAPVVEFSGHEGASHKAQWNAAQRRLDVEIVHNGAVRLVLKAAGGEPKPRWPQGLSRNLVWSRKIEASSAAAECGAALAGDSLHETLWRPNGREAQWLRVDFPESVDISAYKAVGTVESNATVTFRLEKADSADGPWIAVHEGRGSGGFFEVIPVDGIKTRHARLFVPACPQGFGVREWGLYSGPNEELKTWLPLKRGGPIEDLLALLPKASSDAEYRAISDATLDCCRAAADPTNCVSAVLKALGGAEELGVAALIRALGKVRGVEALEAVRKAIRDPRRDVQEEACWALAYWPDPAALADMMAVARETKDLSLRGAMLLNLVVAMKEATDLKPEQRERLLAEGLTLAPVDRQKDEYLPRVRECSIPEALEAAAMRLHDPDSPSLAEPARAACLEIAGRLAKKDPAAPKRVLEALRDRVTVVPLREAIESLLKGLP